MRVQPDTGRTQRVPHGHDIADFTLEPDGRHAWVTTSWRWPHLRGRGGAWRLNLESGRTFLHALPVARRRRRVGSFRQPGGNYFRTAPPHGWVLGRGTVARWLESATGQ